MRPPIPGAHPAVTAQDGHREEGEITHHTRGGGGDDGGGALFFCFAAKAKAKSPGWDPRLVPNSIK